MVVLYNVIIIITHTHTIKYKNVKQNSLYDTSGTTVGRAGIKKIEKKTIVWMSK